MTYFFQFEVEHLFPVALYNDADVAAELRRLGIPLEPRGNKIALFSEADVVERIQQGVRNTSICCVNRTGVPSGMKAEITTQAESKPKKMRSSSVKLARSSRLKN